MIVPLSLHCIAVSGLSCVDFLKLDRTPLVFCMERVMLTRLFHQEQNNQF